MYENKLEFPGGRGQAGAGCITKTWSKVSCPRKQHNGRDQALITDLQTDSPNMQVTITLCSFMLHSLNTVVNHFPKGENTPSRVIRITMSKVYRFVWEFQDLFKGLNL